MSASFPQPANVVLETYEEKAQVTFIWPRGPQTGILSVAWKKGCSIKQYLHEQPLRQFPLLSMWRRCRKLNKKRQRVQRLSYVPIPGDVIVFQRLRK